MSNDLKWNKQFYVAAAKANSVLGQIKNSFSFRERDTIIPLYSALVRPHLEYAVSTWCPIFKTDISVLERVQRRATKLVKAIEEKPYGERLGVLNLLSLEERRVRGDLIQMFKIVHKLEDITLMRGVNYARSLSLNLRRSNDKKLVREINRRGLYRYNFLTNRVVEVWN